MRYNPLLVLMLLPCLAVVAAAQGRNWEITTNSGDFFEDVDLVELQGDSLLVDDATTSRAIYLGSIRELRRNDGSYLVSGTLIGMLAGGAVMWLTLPTRGDAPPVYHMAGTTGLGTLIGALAGANTKRETNYPLAMTTIATKKETLREILAEEAESRRSSPIHNGIFLELGGNSRYYSFNYERIFWNYLALRVGASYDPESEVTLPLMINGLIFDGAHRIELGLGAPWSSEDSGFHPALFVGYRYQPPRGGMMLRIGYTSFFTDKPMRGPDFENALPVGISFGYAF